MLGNFLIYQGTKESRDKITANQHHIKIQDPIQQISNITSTFNLNKNLINSILEIIIKIREKTSNKIIKILTRVHQHGVQNKTS